MASKSNRESFDPDEFLRETAPLVEDVPDVAGFDPDAFLAETAPLVEDTFDPDAFLQETAPEAPKRDDLGFTQERVEELAQKHGADAEDVRRLYQSYGIPAGEVGAVDALRQGVGAIARTFGMGIPQMISRLREDDPERLALMEDVAKDVYGEATWGEFFQDVIGGFATGAGVVSAAGKAAGLAFVPSKGARAAQAASALKAAKTPAEIKSAQTAAAARAAKDAAIIRGAQTAAAVGETGVSVAAVMPGEEGMGAAIGVGMAGTLALLPGMARVARKLLKGDAPEEAATAAARRAADPEDAELRALITEDEGAMINKVERVLEQRGEEIEAVGNLLQAPEMKRIIPELFQGKDPATFTAFARMKNEVPSVRRELEALDTLKGSAAPSRLEIERAFDERIAKLPKGRADRVERIQASKAQMLRDFDEIADLVPQDAAAELAAVAMEMRARGIRGDVSTYQEFRRLKTDVMRLARETDPKMKELDLFNPKDLSKLTRLTDRAMRQGKIDGDAYRTLLLKDELTRQVEADVLVRQASVGMSINDPAKSLLKAWIYPVRYMAGDVDRVLNIGMGETFDRVVSAYSNRTFINERWGRQADALFEAIQERGLDPARITRALESPNIQADLTRDELRVFRGVRQYFDSIRRQANVVHGKNVPKLEDYAPQQAKPVRELVKAMKERAEETVMRELGELPEHTSLDLFRKYIAEDATQSAAEATAMRDALDMASYLRRATDVEIETLGDLKRVLAEIRPNMRLKSQANFDAGAAFSRKGPMPDWAREWNVGRLMLRYADSMADSVAMSRAINEMNAKVHALRKAGMEDSAKWFEAYIDNVSGVKRGLRAKMEETQVMEGIAEVIGADSEVMKEVVGRMIGTVYPAHLGFNVRAYTRNLSQPFLMTAPEIAASGATHAYGQGLAMKALKKATGVIFKDGKPSMVEVKRALAERKLAPRAYRGEMRDEVRSGIREMLPNWLKKWDRIIQKFENGAMYLYSQSDFQNRYVTMLMADELSDDLLRGARSLELGQAVEGRSKQAINFLKGVDEGQREAMRRSLRRAMQGAEGAEQAFKDIMAGYLINKTQLTYGTVGMAQFGRFAGPAFSMFTTWPTNIGAEMIQAFQRYPDRGAVRMGRKFLAPAVGLYAINRAMQESEMTRAEDSPRVSQLTYPGGIYPLYSPMFAGFDLAGMTRPPAVEVPLLLAKGITEALEGEGTKAARSGFRLGEKVMRSHVPLISTSWNSFDRVYEMLTDEESPTKEFMKSIKP